MFAFEADFRVDLRFYYLPFFEISLLSFRPYKIQQYCTQYAQRKGSFDVGKIVFTQRHQKFLQCGLVRAGIMMSFQMLHHLNHSSVCFQQENTYFEI